VRIFTPNGSRLVEITKEPFQLEKEVQRLTEANLHDLFNLYFVKSEFELKYLRVDTLAFDKESAAFIIIEYKKDRNFSVVDQGVAYLNLMLNHKADFILEYNEVFPNQPLRREDVDWSQSKVIFIAPEFTKYQQYALGYRDLAIQLWEVHKYTNGLVAYNEIEPTEKHLKRQSISSITKTNPDAKRVAKEIRVYSEEDLVKIVEQRIRDLYFEVKDAVLNLGNDVSMRVTKNYIAFKRKVAFMGVHSTKSGLRIDFHAKSSELPDSKGIAKPVSKGDWSVLSLTKSVDIPYVLSLAKIAYEKG
jgi:predicted transport protein